MVILGNRVLLKEIKEDKENDSGLIDAYDDEALPEAEIISVSEELVEKVPEKNLPKPGDRVYYIRPRERGRVPNKEDHFIVDYATIAAIL